MVDDPFIDLIDSLMNESEESKEQIIGMLESGSNDYAALTEHMNKYIERHNAADILMSQAGDPLTRSEGILSASDLLEHTSTKTNILPFDPVVRAQGLSTEKTASTPDDESPLVNKDTLLENTVVSKSHLHLAGIEDSNKFELQLAVIDTSGQVTEIELIPQEGMSLVIGRARAKPVPGVDLAIDDTSVSSQHCEISWTAKNGWRLADFGTTNGTELNGEPVVGEICMTKIGEIRIGNSVIKFFPKAQQANVIENMRLIVEN